MGKVKQGVTGDGDMPPLPMTEEEYKAMAYERYNCIDERSGRIEQAVPGRSEIGLHIEAGLIEALDYFTLKAERKRTSKADYYAFVEKTFADMLALIKRKNADYTAGADDAFANFRRAEPVVPMLQATWVRWGDKIQRVDAFFRNGKLEVTDEGLEDALLDVIGYSMIMLGELKELGNVE